MENFSAECEKFLKDVYRFKGRLSIQKYSELATKIFLICICYLAFKFLIENFLEYNPEYVLLDSAFFTFKVMYAVLSWIGVICVVIRRLHDMNKSGWRILTPLIIGFCTNLLVVWLIYTFYLSTKEGTDGKNKYGDKPIDDE